MKRLAILLFLYGRFILPHAVNGLALAEVLSPCKVVREDERGIEILYVNNFSQECHPYQISGGRKVDDYPFPAIEIFIGIPQKGNISLSASGAEEVLWEGQLTADCDGNPLPPIIPEKPLAEIKRIEYLRDVRSARIHLFPIHKIEKGLKIYTRIEININYSHPPQIVEKKDYFDFLYEEVLLNGERAKFYKCEEREGGDFNFFTRSLNWIKIKIDSTGIYKITPDDLERIGISTATINPRTLRIYHIGRFISNNFYPDTMVELPIYVAGEDDGSFDENDFILFYGERLHSLYTNFNYYWLTFGISDGKRMDKYSGQPLPSSPLLTTAEDSIFYELDLLCPARSGLLWLWEAFPKAKGEEKNYQKRFVLPQAKTLKKITLAFCPKSDTCRLRLFLDTHFLDSLLVSRPYGQLNFIYKKSTTLPLTEDITLDFLLYGEKDAELYLDWINFIYEKDLTRSKENAIEFLIKETGDYNILLKGIKNPLYLFEIIMDTLTSCPKLKMVEDFSLVGESLVFGRTFSNPAHFLLLNEKGFRKPLSLEIRRPYRLRNPHFTADYLIITPEEFRRPAQILRNYRQNNIKDMARANAQLATLSEIYDEYSFGIEEPGSIKKFLKDKRPYYVTLIGDATYDYRSLLPYKKYPGVPTYEYGYDFSPNPYTDKAYACDAWYADLDGQGYSPDIILSRLPVRNEKELLRFIRKLTIFEKNPGGENLKRFLLCGDDEFNGYYDRPDNIRFGTHIEQCEDIGSLLGPGFEQVKIYLTEYPYQQYGDKPQAREALISAINKGIIMMCFFGHGWTAHLTHEKLLNLSALSSIKNGNRLFFGFYGSCGVGKFDETENECLAEELQRMEGGAIATVAASKATSSSINFFFAQSLFSPLISYRTGIIGKGFLSAWATDRKYHLFGEGATFIPLTSRTDDLAVSPETLKPGEIIRINVDSTAFPKGHAHITVYGPQVYRYYRSYLGSLNYILPGEIIFQGRERIKEKRIAAEFLFPCFPYPEVRYVENGSYTLIPNSCQIRILAINRDSSIFYIKDSISFLNQEVPSSDSIGPEITLYYKGRQLKDGDKVERELNLEGRIYDESGIALLKSYPLGFYINNPIDWQDLRDRIVFDYSSFKSAHFTYPLRLSAPCSLFFLLSDNLGNETKERIILNIISDTNLVIDEPLYIATKNSGYFTFNLNLPAFVTIKIYSISGRFLKEIKTFGEYGQNVVYFDNRDNKGERLPRGLYFYRIDAKTLDRKKAKLIERFIIK